GVVAHAGSACRWGEPSVGQVPSLQPQDGPAAAGAGVDLLAREGGEALGFYAALVDPRFHPPERRLVPAARMDLVGAGRRARGSIDTSRRERPRAPRSRAAWPA